MGKREDHNGDVQLIFSVGAKDGGIVTSVQGAEPWIVQGLVQLLIHLDGSYMKECMWAVARRTSELLDELHTQKRPLTPQEEDRIVNEVQLVIEGYADKYERESKALMEEAGNGN